MADLWKRLLGCLMTETDFPDPTASARIMWKRLLGRLTTEMHTSRASSAETYHVEKVARSPVDRDNISNDGKGCSVA
jgi:hypothetical protein